MLLSCVAPAAGYLLDILFGDPLGRCHPVALMGRLIGFLEKGFRRLLPKTKSGEIAAGALVFVLTAGLSWLIPFLLLRLCGRVSVWLRLAAESFLCWQVLAARGLADAGMQVYSALESGDIVASREAVSRIVGRETAALDAYAVTRAAVETVAENTSDGVVAPMLFMAVGGAPLALLYKAVNTMDSMLGYVEPPYKNVGLVPARADDAANFIPARLSALLMLAAGALLHLDVKNGFRIFKRDRYKHASPNSAQTESVCAGLLGVRLAGDAVYHGVLHKKEFIGDPLRAIRHEDIRTACRLMYLTSFLSLLLCLSVRFLILRG